jgi:hypothetical protein
MQTETYMFDVNLASQEAVEDAFREGCRKIGLECDERRPQLKELFDAYEDATIPDDIAAKCAAAGINLEEHFANDYCEEDELIGTPESYANFWMAVAKIGEPTLEYTAVVGGKIYAGGYGLFT